MSAISGFIKIEKREQLLGGRFDFPRQMLWSAGFVLFTIATHYLLIIFQTRLGEDVIPTYVPNSFFGMLYSYVTIALVGLTIHFSIHPKLFSFAEINNNRCNLLIKMGLATAGITASRLNATLVAAGVTYSVGYVLTFVFCFIIRLNFVLNYLLSVYFVGLYAVIMFTMLAMMLGIILNRQQLSSITTVFSLVITLVVLAAFGYYSYLEPESLATNIASMLELKAVGFLSLATLLLIIFYSLCVIIGSGKSENFRPKQFIPDQLAGDYVSDDVIATRTAVLVAAQKKIATPNQPIKPGNVAPMTVPRPQKQAHKLKDPVSQPPQQQPPQQPPMNSVNAAHSTNRPISNTPPQPKRPENPQQPMQPPLMQQQQRQAPPQQQNRPQQQPPQQQNRPPQAPPQQQSRPQPPPPQRPAVPPQQQPGGLGGRSINTPPPSMQRNDFQPPRGNMSQMATPMGFGGFDDEVEPVVKMSIAKLIFAILFGIVGLVVLVMTMMSFGVPDASLSEAGLITADGSQLLRLIKGSTSNPLNSAAIFGTAGLFILVAVLLGIMSTGKVVNYRDDDDYDYDDDDYDDDDDY